MRNKIAIIVQARLASSRLPKKVFLKVENKSLLEHLLIRLKKCKLADQIIIATTKSKTDQKIVKFCKKKNICYFRGDEEDVLNRYYECSKAFKIKTIVRITADCPLSDPRLIDKMIKYFKKNSFEYVSNTTPNTKSTFPDGSDVEIFTFKALSKANLVVKNKNDREHVTHFFWKNKKINSKRINFKKNLSNFRYTIDYKEDYKVISFIIRKLIKKKPLASYYDIVKFMKKNFLVIKKFRPKNLRRNHT